MNPADKLSPPLTLDEAFQLAGFLAERGHTDTASDIIHSAVSSNVVSAVVAMHEAATR
jgi:hypothetical protein